MINEKAIRAELAKVVKNDNHDGTGFFRYPSYRTAASDELIARGWARSWQRDLVEATSLGRCIAVLHKAWATTKVELVPRAKRRAERSDRRQGRR